MLCIITRHRMIHLTIPKFAPKNLVFDTIKYENIK